jgi:hypothetical protein
MWRKTMYDDHVTIPVCLKTGASKLLIGDIRYLNDGDRALVKTNSNKIFYIAQGVVYMINNDNNGDLIYTSIGRVA